MMPCAYSVVQKFTELPIKSMVLKTVQLIIHFTRAQVHTLPIDPSPPDKVLSGTDKGDDVQRRYRYQAAYAALISLDLLKEDSEFEEIFCEHHEDILVRCKDHKFVGVQVKTRKPGGGPFTFGDQEIINSLIRFVKLEEEFPNHFKSYVIAANCGFWQKIRNHSNLVHCLKSVRNNDSKVLSSDSFLKRVGAISKGSNCNQDLVMNVLRKVRTEESPSLGEYESLLFQSMARIPEIRGERVDFVFKAANSLIDTMFRAGSLAHTSPKSAYFALLNDPEKAEKDEIIQGKRITRDIVKQVTHQAMSSVMELRTREPVELSNLPKGMRTMELKMAKGGLSIQNIDLAKDLKYSAMYLLTGWLHKYGPNEATYRNQHLGLIVRNECQEAYDLVKTDSELFGENMLIEVRKRLRKRYLREINSLYNDCLYEHLLGIAAILTEECKVWWSEVFGTPQGVSL